MYIISLILAIIACMSAFLPFYGIIFSFLMGTLSIVISAINIHSKEKKIVEISIISIIVCVISFLICIGINIYTAFFGGRYTVDNEVSFSNLSDDYPEFGKEDYVSNDKLKFKITDYKIEGNNVYVNYTMQFLGEERSFSAFDFYILDESTDEIYYITYDNDSEYIYNYELGNNKEISAKMKFNLKDNYNIDSLYLVYKDDKSNFKVKI